MIATGSSLSTNVDKAVIMELNSRRRTGSSVSGGPVVRSFYGIQIFRFSFNANTFNTFTCDETRSLAAVIGLEFKIFTLLFPKSSNKSFSQIVY